jgi:hypothetical protein
LLRSNPAKTENILHGTAKITKATAALAGPRMRRGTHALHFGAWNKKSDYKILEA